MNPEQNLPEAQQLPTQVETGADALVSSNVEAATPEIDTVESQKAVGTTALTEIASPEMPSMDVIMPVQTRAGGRSDLPATFPTRGSSTLTPPQTRTNGRMDLPASYPDER